MAPFFAELAAARRATTMDSFWIAAERLDLVRCACPGAQFTPRWRRRRSRASCRNRAKPASPNPTRMVRMRCPAACIRTGARPGAAAHLVEIALAQLEAEGQILRGHFLSRGGDEEIEWAHRRLLARIHRLTIGRLRREIEPVTTAQFAAFLARWQHLAAGTQLHGVEARCSDPAIAGPEWPAAAWESEVLPRRIAGYDPALLDELCLSGEVMWGRLSPHPAFERESDGEGRRVRPTRVAPLAVFLREDADWLLASPEPQPVEALSHPAREVLAALRTRGASFFHELVRDAERVAGEVENALWELVAAGLVTADGFENLRALLNPHRRRIARPRHAPGAGPCCDTARARRPSLSNASRASSCNAGRGLPRHRGARDLVASVARHFGGAAQNGDARRDSRRPLRRRIRRRAIRPSRGA